MGQTEARRAFCPQPDIGDDAFGGRSGPGERRRPGEVPSPRTYGSSSGDHPLAGRRRAKEQETVYGALRERRQQIGRPEGPERQPRRPSRSRPAWEQRTSQEVQRAQGPLSDVIRGAGVKTVRGLHAPKLGVEPSEPPRIRSPKKNNRRSQQCGAKVYQCAGQPGRMP